jgi:starvation-inducible DNA-binding protein
MSAKLELLNQITADALTLFVKLHKYHWYIQGPQFFAVHNATEEYYNHFAGVYDDAAERMLQLGGQPATTLADYLKGSGIKEEPAGSTDLKTVVRDIGQDFEYMLKNFKTLTGLAGEERDHATVNLADGQIAWLEKAIWMLNSMK